MKNIWLMTLVPLFIFLTHRPVRAAAAAPAFEKYLVPVTEFGLSIRLNGRGKFLKRYRTQLSEQIKKGPNFAGSFRLTQIGCGSGCSLIGLIDCVSGQVVDPKILVVDTEKTERLGDRVEFRVDSRLLVLRGCLNERDDRCGIHEFTLEKSKLKLLRFAPTP